VILLDSIGELRAVYPLAEIVFVGGSLIPHGGQNILEPAISERAIVTGFYTMNFAAIVKELTRGTRSLGCLNSPKRNTRRARRCFCRAIRRRGST
jgi:3-deoxy-D-manno-octulosonic-acid transferase